MAEQTSCIPRSKEALYSAVHLMDKMKMAECMILSLTLVTTYNLYASPQLS